MPKHTHTSECLCPVCGKYTYYSEYYNKHACIDPDCSYAHGELE